MKAADPSVVWRLPMPLRERLIGPSGLRLPEWLADGRASVIKDAAHRTIYRVVLDGLDFYLKEYRAVGLRGRFREFCRPIKAKIEFKRGLPAALGVPAPKPLGWGVLGSRLAPTASFLITETVAAAQPLLHLLTGPLPAQTRQRLAVALGEFLARLHGAGVVHRDLHPGNMLARSGPTGNPELFLIDLHQVRVGTPSPWSVRRTNLIVFNRYFILRATRADRLRFWRAYAAQAGDAVPDLPSATPQALDEATWRSNARFWAARDRRPVSANRLFGPVDFGRYRGHAVREDDPTPLAKLLTDPEAVLASPTATALKDGQTSKVVELALPDGRRVVLKRFNKRLFVDAIKNALRPSSALRSWVLGHGLIDSMMPTAKPLAVVHRYRLGLPAEGYLLAEKIAGVVDLREFVDGLPDRDRRHVLRARVDAVARLLREFHRRSLGHRDLKAPNLLTPADPQDHRAWFVDLVGVRRRTRSSRACRARDLGRLSASFHNCPELTRTDKLRFLRTYLNWPLRGKWGWQRWWCEIAAFTEAKVTRNARRGRPVG